MAERLIILTNTFPYGQGEEFVEAELPIVARHFDDVLILATQVTDANQTRTLPPNVRAVPIQTPGQSITERLRFLGSGLPLIARDATARVRAMEGFPRPRAFASSVFFEARAQWIAARTLSALDGVEWADDDEVVIYSFWLHVAARVGELVRSYLVSRQPKLPIHFVSRAHAYDLYAHLTTLRFLPQREALLKALDLVMPISEEGAEYLNSLYPAYAEKIVSHRLGTADPDPVPTSARDRLRVTTCSFVVPVKRLDRVPSIVEAVAERGIPVTWTHIGAGPGFADLQARVAAVNKQAEVQLLGYVPHDRLFETYAEHPSTVLLNVSKREGIPVSMMELISGGIPILATAVGGVPEIVRPGISGWLLPSDFTDEQAVDALERVWHLDEEEYSALQATARQLWEDEFRATTAYEKFVDFLKK